jgi:DUF1365 family protein
MTASMLYFGTVLHRRLRPRTHILRYRLFWTFFELDEIPELPKQSILFSYNRFNILSFHDRDHCDRSGTALRPQVEKTLAEHGIVLDGGAIRLFCMPRVFGYSFNPISIYFCHFGDGRLAAIVYEVHNTFGERHSYVFDAHEHGVSAAHGGDKRFHVSPFIGMDMRYEFRTLLPKERFALAIRGSDAGGTLIHASLAGVARPFTNATLLRGLLLYPLLTFKVTAAIHWHALRLWLKGIPVRRKPAPPTQPTTPVRVS